MASNGVTRSIPSPLALVFGATLASLLVYALNGGSYDALVRHREAFVVWALVALVVGNLRETRVASGQLDVQFINAVASAALVALALYLALLALVRLRSGRRRDTLTPAHEAVSLE